MAVKKFKVLKQFTHGEKVGEFSSAKVHLVGEIVEIELTPEIEQVLVQGGHIHIIEPKHEWTDAQTLSAMHAEDKAQVKEREKPHHGHHSY